jgi:hypothetical protein
MNDNVSSEATVLGLDNIPLELPVAAPAAGPYPPRSTT